jgi:hypothetical protein
MSSIFSVSPVRRRKIAWALAWSSQNVDSLDS